MARSSPRFLETRQVPRDSAYDILLVFEQREETMPTIREIMTVDLITVSPSVTVMRAASAMLAGKAGSVLVVDGSDLVGIFTERDVLRALVHHSDAGRASSVTVRPGRDLLPPSGARTHAGAIAQPPWMTPIADPHICKPPPSAERTEPEWECRCGWRWHLEWFRMPGGWTAGPSWILEASP